MKEQVSYREPPLSVDGDIYHYDPKDDPTDDCFYQAGDLWRLIPENEKGC